MQSIFLLYIIDACELSWFYFTVDNTRVPLNASYRPSMVRDGKPTSGYINASFIKVCC